MEDSQDPTMQKLHKEFYKIKELGYQFQIYLMLLERFLGQSSKEYQFLMGDNQLDEPKNTRTEKSIVCVLDSIRSAHNVGTFFRNSDCFGVEKLYLTGLTPQGDHPQVIKTSMQAENFIKWEYEKDTITIINKLKNESFKIIAIDTARTSTSLNDWKPDTEKLALVFGHEQFGISYEALQLADEIVSIPMWGQKNSLNVGVCQGIVLQAILSKEKRR